jgi:hypothetical protein
MKKKKYMSDEDFAELKLLLSLPEFLIRRPLHEAPRITAQGHQAGSSRSIR